MLIGDEQSIDVQRVVSQKLLNGTNKNMNANGSLATPIIYQANYHWVKSGGLVECLVI